MNDFRNRVAALMALAMLVLAGCTQTVAFKMIDPQSGLPLKGIRAAYGDNALYPFLPFIFGFVVFNEHSVQFSGEDGMVTFTRIGTGGYFSFRVDDGETRGLIAVPTWFGMQYSQTWSDVQTRQDATKDAASGAYVVKMKVGASSH